MANSIMVIKPYKYEGMWVFDDVSRGLDKEALVSGVPQILQALTMNIGLPDKEAEKGFRLVFSENPFPGFHISCKHLEEAGGDGDLGSDEVLHGNWYEVTGMYTPDGNVVPQAQGMRGWLCPALFKFFDHTPKTLYVMAEKID